MKAIRVTFVSLIALGACGVVYVGLTAGLAAFVRYKTGATAGSNGQQASADAATNATPATPTSKPAARPATPAVEDAATLLRRQWTAPRAGLTTPPPLAAGPDASRKMLVPVVFRTSLPRPEPGVLARVQLLKFEQPGELRPRPPTPEPVFELVLADRKRVELPALPAVKLPPADPGEVRVASVAVPRDADRPQSSADPGEHAAEQVLLTKSAPLRIAAAPFERNAIPDPTPNSAGDIHTVVSDADAPISPPERPAAVKFAVK